MNHSYDAAKKIVMIKKANKNEPLIIKKKDKGIATIELNILF